MNNLFVAEANQNKYLMTSIDEEIKLKEFDFESKINYSDHDNFSNQLKIFFGFDPENPGISYYPDALIIKDSDSVRDIYKLKLNDMTLIK